MKKELDEERKSRLETETKKAETDQSFRKIQLN